MKKIFIKTVKFIMFLSIGLGLLYLAAKELDLNKVWEVIKSANYFWIILSLVVAVFAHFSRAQRWRLLIEPLGHYPSFKNTFYSVMIGYLANYAFPRIGEITRCGMLNRSNKIPVDSLIGTVIIERAIDLLFSVFFLLFLIIGKFSLFGNFFREEFFNSNRESSSGMLHNKVLLSILGGAIVILLIFLLFRKRLMQFTVFQKIIKILKGIGAGLSSLYRMKRRWQFIFHSLIIWFCYLLMSYLVFFAFPFTSQLGLLDAVFILVAGTVGMIMPVPGGLGAFHYFVPLALTLYGIPREDGLSFATVQHGSQSLFVILLGTLSFILIYKSLHLKRENKTQQKDG